MTERHRLHLSAVGVRLAPLAFVLALLVPAGTHGDVVRAPGDRYHVYRLDNISTTHALQILRTLGYSVLPAGAAATADGLARPVILELPDSDPELSSLVRGTSDLGGSPLHGPTVGQPHQRLLIVWDAADPETFESLLGLLQEQIDERAKQILIEAVVLEIDRDRIQDLGVSVSGSKDGQSLSAFHSDGEGKVEPFTFTFRRPSVKTLLDLEVKIDALVAKGEASILSQPSIMVLDGRQARIKVGDNIPITEVASSTFNVENQLVTSTKYIETGITLNLRPRAAEDDSEVTLQVETLISSPAGSSQVTPDGVLLGPEIRTREVQTLVRVADDTPFIIGGLITDEMRTRRTGLPWLSEVPGIGALFRRTNDSRRQKEVIIVITPHVLPLAERNFRYSVLGKDFEQLDRFDLELFQNLYRIKSDDVFDLDFIYESELYDAMHRAADLFGREFERRARAAGWVPVAPGDRAALAAQVRRALAEQPEFLHELERDHPGLEIGEPMVQLLAGGIPGEDILVKRMLLAIVEKLDFGRHVDPESITFFRADMEDQLGSLELVEVDRLLPWLERIGADCGGKTLELVFESQASGLEIGGVEVSFDAPGAHVETTVLSGEADYLRELRALNRMRPGGGWERLGILLDDCHELRERSSLDLLRDVLVLKRLLDVNPALPLTLQTFHPGRELVFPSEENIAARQHVIDRKTAELFYETLDYFYAFEKVYKMVFQTIAALSHEERPAPAADVRSEERAVPAE